MESVVHMELLRDPVKILWSSHIGHGTFAAIVVHQLFHALASLRGQRLPVVLLQRPNHLAKSGSQHFSCELRCPDRKGNRFLVYFFLHKTSSYYKVVVIRVPLQGQNATIDKVLWIGLNLLPQDGFGKAPTTALCF